MYGSIGFEHNKNHKYFIKIKNENLSLAHPGNLRPRQFINYYGHLPKSHLSTLYYHSNKEFTTSLFFPSKFPQQFVHDINEVTCVGLLSLTQ